MKFFTLEFKNNQKSSWNLYPHYYKFMSIHLQLTSDINKIERQTYDLLDYLGDIGGLIEIIYYGTRAMIFPFAAMRMKALLVTRLYHLSASTKGVATNLKKLHMSGLTDRKIHSNRAGFN